MIVQDVTALPAFNPHCGPITHSSTGPKPNSTVNPLFPRLFLARGLVSNSWATFREIINSVIIHNTYSHSSKALSHSDSGNEWLPISLELLITPSYSTLDDFLECQHERCLYTSFTEIAPRYLTGVELRPSRVFPLNFPKYDGDPEERVTT